MDSAVFVVMLSNTLISLIHWFITSQPFQVVGRWIFHDCK